MNDLYGVDPSTPSNLRDLSDLLRVFDPGSGRFIADFPMDWGKELKEHMNRFSDLGAMGAVQVWLDKSNHAFLPVKARFKNGQTWQENALSLRDEVVKLIGPAGKPANVVQPIDQILVDPNGFPDASGSHIPRTPESYVKAIQPILLSSPKVVLVDPFFSLRYRDKYTGVWKTDRRSKFISLLLKFAATARRVECFEIFTDPTKTSDSSICLDDLKSIAEASGAGSMHLQIRHLDKKLLYEGHPRYLLGLASGLHFDHGFDISDDGSTNHVEWIGKTALTPLLDKFT